MSDNTLLFVTLEGLESANLLGLGRADCERGRKRPAALNCRHHLQRYFSEKQNTEQGKVFGTSVELWNMNNINTLENGNRLASRFFWSPTLIYMRDIFSFKFIEITVSTMSEQQP